MSDQFHCKACQLNFTVDQKNTEMVYALNGSSKLIARCLKCQAECDKVNNNSNQEDEFDKLMEELSRQYGPGCGGGGCSCG